jgi:hypothetical protein
MPYIRWFEDPTCKTLPRTPLNMSGLLLTLLKQHFSYNSPQFKYSPNPIESRILLDLHQQWNPHNCDNYPGVYVKREAWQPTTTVLGNYSELMIPDKGYSYSFFLPITAGNWSSS